MMTFIVEYWLQITVYLVGAVLAYGRMVAQIEAFKKHGLWDGDGSCVISAIVWVGLSWAGFIMVSSFYEKGDRFFKFVPMMLLLCGMVGFGCTHQNLPYKCSGVDGTSYNSDIQYTKGTRINWGSGNPGWTVDSCYFIEPFDTLAEK